MSHREILDEAFEALREAKGGTSSTAGSTRLAIVAASSRRDRRRVTVVKFVLPLAAVLIVSTAWAAATGRLSALSELFRPAPKSGASVPANPKAASSAPPDADDTIEGAVPRPEPEPEPEPVSVQPAPSTAARTTPRPSPSAERSTIDPEEALYRKAHAAHFNDRDWSGALAAWDAYLAAHPKGRFSPEAQYNRALTLVRLGRRDLAREALRPFADGTTYDGYRQREAASLLDALQ